MLRLCFDFIFQTDHRNETRPPITNEEDDELYEQKTASKEVHSFIIILLITRIQ